MLNPNSNSSPPTQKKVVITAVLLFLICNIAILEAVARFAYAYQEEIKNNEFVGHYLDKIEALDPYEVIDENVQNHWRLKPSYSATSTEIVNQKKAMGKGLDFVGAEPEKVSNTLRLNINSQGFRGDEILDEENGQKILILGDSVTFGLVEQNYPDLLESILRAAGHKIQVINGGVEGYSVRNHLLELDRYLAVKPDAVFIYIGWNTLYSAVSWLSPTEKNWRMLWLLRNAFKSLWRFYVGSKRLAIQQYEKRGVPDSQDPVLKYIDNFRPRNIDLIIDLTNDLRASGSKIFWVTQASLLTTKRLNTEGALSKGYLPEFTSNPLVIAKLNERYNDLLRSNARKNGAVIIDAEKWALTNLQPMENYFIDTVHFNSQGLRKLSEFLAEETIKHMYAEE